jgi:hypothetical protein
MPSDTASIGSILIPEMRRRGYPSEFAAGVTVASSTMGMIIPPSIPMVIYAVTAQVSVGKLFLGGVIPGILVGLFQLVLSVPRFYCEIACSRLSRTTEGTENTEIKTVCISGFSSVPSVVLPPESITRVSEPSDLQREARLLDCKRAEPTLRQSPAMNIPRNDCPSCGVPQFRQYPRRMTESALRKQSVTL